MEHKISPKRISKPVQRRRQLTGPGSILSGAVLSLLILGGVALADCPQGGPPVVYRVSGSVHENAGAPRCNVTIWSLAPTVGEDLSWDSGIQGDAEPAGGIFRQARTSGRVVNGTLTADLFERISIENSNFVFRSMCAYTGIWVYIRGNAGTPYRIERTLTGEVYENASASWCQGAGGCIVSAGQAGFQPATYGVVPIDDTYAYEGTTSGNATFFDEYPGVPYRRVHTFEPGGWSELANVWAPLPNYAVAGGTVHAECQAYIVAGQPPVAEISGPITADTHIPVAFSGESSLDPDGGPLEYRWGADGSPTISGENETNCEMTWAEPGTHTVYLTVTDCDGRKNTAAHEVVISPMCSSAPPVVEYGAPRLLDPTPEMPLYGIGFPIHTTATFYEPCECCEYRQYVAVASSAWRVLPGVGRIEMGGTLQYPLEEDHDQNGRPYGHRIGYLNKPCDPANDRIGCDIYTPDRDDGDHYEAKDLPAFYGGYGIEVDAGYCFLMRVERVPNPGCPSVSAGDCVVQGSERRADKCFAGTLGDSIKACTGGICEGLENPSCTSKARDTGRTSYCEIPNGTSAVIEANRQGEFTVISVFVPMSEWPPPDVSVSLNGQEAVSGGLAGIVDAFGRHALFGFVFPRNDSCRLDVSLTIDGQNTLCPIEMDFVPRNADFDACAIGHTTPAPGSDEQEGWYQDLAAGDGYGEIQNAVSVSGNALHEFAPASNPCGAQTIDAHDVSCSDLDEKPFITMEADFLAHCSNLDATNPYTATLTCMGGEDETCTMIGFSVNGGNDEVRLESGVSIGAAFFNGVDNNEPIPLQVGQGLAWDTWHHVKVVLDHGGDRYLYIEVNGERQNLSGFRPPQTESGGVWRRGQTLERLLAQVISCPWDAPNLSDDDIYWDNIELRTESVPTSVEGPSPGVVLATGWSIEAFNRVGATQVELACKLPTASQCWVKVFSIRGELVRSVYQGEMQAGEQLVFWDGRDNGGRVVPAGVYLVKLSDGRDGASTKVLLLK